MQIKPLSGKTIVVTGSASTTTVMNEIKRLGGQARFCPLIDTKEIIDANDQKYITDLNQYNWLIFTSKNAVEAFCKKMKRFGLQSSQIQVKIAAVGAKTAELLEKNNLSVSFMPSVYSADVFVKEFPIIAGEHAKCLFIRGNLAKDTLKNGLPFVLKEWTVYETRENFTSINPLIELVHATTNLIIIFASPSAVDVYAKNIATVVGWGQVEFASIGHITAAAIKDYGTEVTYMPKEYTMQAVIEEITKREDA
ncbi:uroporphyrinogen-III synthase [Ureibacillus sp. NPDC094379]